MKRGTRFIVKTAMVLAVAAGGASAAAADTFIPGYTDFPNALRVADEQTPFIPGYTDFPNALRLRPAATIRTTAPVAALPETSASGFSWADAGIGAGVTATLALLLVAASAGLRKKTRLSVSS
ncbi:MAG: hypothetical protein QOE13_1946 [Gaiellaceae bacterium]|jgi:hypothetical protein|nr:hypothetical protein [Gaiellaceae bacterium]